MSEVDPVPALDEVWSSLDAHVPNHAFHVVEACFDVTYEGSEATSSYTFHAMARTRDLGPTKKAGESYRSTLWGKAGRGPSLRALQVTRIHDHASGESLEFNYGKAAPMSYAGPVGTHFFAPTVLQEIAFPGGSMRMDWEGCLAPDLALKGSRDVAPAACWTYGIASIQALAGPAGALAPAGPAYHCTSVAAAMEAGSPAPNGHAWVRQSRHIALGPDDNGLAVARTFVRDRWELRKGGETALENPQQRIPFSFEGDIATYDLDLETRTLLPVAGQVSRWLNWKEGPGGMNLPPDIHGRLVDPARPRLLGGGPKVNKWNGPASYNPGNKEVTLTAYMGAMPAGGGSGAIPPPPFTTGASLMGKLVNQNQKLHSEIGAKAAAASAAANKAGAAATAAAHHAQQQILEQQRKAQQEKANKEAAAKMQAQMLKAQQLAAIRVQNQLQVQAQSGPFTLASRSPATGTPDTTIIIPGRPRKADPEAIRSRWPSHG